MMTTDASMKAAQSVEQRGRTEKTGTQAPQEFYQKLIRRPDTRKIVEKLATK